MKLAIPTRDGKVDDHFGHCDHYTIFTINGKEIVGREDLPSPQGCGCKSGIAADLEKMGVEVMLAGNMGDGALNKLSAHNIRVIRGCRGDIEAVVRGFLLGFILDSGVGCSAHAEGHECAHHDNGHSDQH